MRGPFPLLTARRLRAYPVLAVVVVTLAAAAPPPNSDDPDRVHLDPGVWPILIFIVALFVLALVIRGSRPRRKPGPASAADRRPEQRRQS